MPGPGGSRTGSRPGGAPRETPSPEKSSCCPSRLRSRNGDLSNRDSGVKSRFDGSFGPTGVELSVRLPQIAPNPDRLRPGYRPQTRLMKSTCPSRNTWGFGHGSRVLHRADSQRPSEIDVKSGNSTTSHTSMNTIVQPVQPREQDSLCRALAIVRDAHPPAPGALVIPLPLRRPEPAPGP